jgi:hypothetical protein
MEMNRLQKQGYKDEILADEVKNLHPKNWSIDEICRFEGMSNPADNSILYAISEKDGKRRSLIVDNFGAADETAYAAFIAQVPESDTIKHS